MSGPDGGGEASRLELIEDWITIWHSELAAMVFDREQQDTLLRMVEGWATQSRAMVALAAPAATVESASGPARADAPPRPPAADAASAGSARLVDQLRARIAELERRLDVPGPPA